MPNILNLSQRQSQQQAQQFSNKAIRWQWCRLHRVRGEGARAPTFTNGWAWGALRVVFPFPDVYFYSREYGNGSSQSRAPGNDVYYEWLMTKKSINNVLYASVIINFYQL